MNGMHIMSSVQAIELLDGLACALLAAAGALRARNLGAPLAGAVVLGCVCGLAGALVRELVLHGRDGAKLALSVLPDDVLIGSLGGVLALLFWKNAGRKLFWGADSLSLGLASSLGCVLALPVVGIAGAMAMGLINGLLPSLIRDVALGDTAMIVEKNWYASVSALACIVAIFISLLPVFGAHPDFAANRPGEWAILTGTILVIGLRIWRRDQWED